MKIDSLYISAFGGIKDLKLDFSEKLNVIYGDNENGKSTVMSFIKMMFYGSERGSTQISKSIRKKSTPWDGSVMAGSIDFTHSGKKYRIEREFKTSNSTDRVILIDLDLGTRQTVPADIGIKFFGLSPAAFERSVFIGQFGFPESDNEAEGELNSRLSNIALTGEESVSFETVYKRLEAARFSFMSKSGRAGEYDKNIKAIAELKARIEKAVLANADYSAKLKEAEAKSLEIELLKKNANSLKEQIGAEQDIRNAEKLRQFLSLSEELEDMNISLSDGSVLDEMFLRKVQFQLSKTENAKAKADSKRNEAENFKKSIAAGLNPPKDATEENAKLLEKEIGELEKEKQKLSLKKAELKEKAEQNSALKVANKPYGILLILGVLGAVSSGLFAILLKSLIPTGIMAVLSVIFFILFVTFLSYAKKNALKEAELLERPQKEMLSLSEYEKTIEDGIFAKKVRLEAINTALNSTAEVIKKQSEMLEDIEKELVLLTDEEEKEKEILFKFFSKIRAVDSVSEIENTIPELSEKVQKAKELKQQIRFISSDLGNIEKDKAKVKLEEIEKSHQSLSADFETIKAKYEQITAEINEKTAEAVAIVTAAKTALSNAENPEELRVKLKELEKKAEEQKEFCEVASIAMSALTDSFSEARRSYGSVLEKKAGEIFSKLTGGKYESMNISKSFDINVAEASKFGSREIGYLSSGTADQAYLSLRLALSELISENEKLPLLLDDALAQYDDGRMKTALEFLSEYAEKSQIIIFTCHNAISETAQNTGANKISLKK